MDAPPGVDAARMRNDIVAVFTRQATSGVSLEKAECHYRLCKVELVFADIKADVNVLNPLFMGEDVSEISSYAAYAPTRATLPNGRVRTTLYLAREGAFQFE